MKLMTLNIWNYTRPWPQRRQMIVDLITAYAPDVVMLQETRHDRRFEGGRGQGEQLADLTGFHPAWALGQVYLPIFRIDEGLTTLTRSEPIGAVRRELTLLPGERADENHRVCLAVSIRVGDLAVHVINVHFSLSPVARVCNAREATELASEIAGDEPVFLAGDLNAQPQEAAIRLLLGADAEGADASRWRDCWTESHEGEPGYTCPSWQPAERIDYVFCRGPVKRVVSMERVGAEPRDGVYASDHLGLVVEVEL